MTQWFKWQMPTCATHREEALRNVLQRQMNMLKWSVVVCLQMKASVWLERLGTSSFKLRGLWLESMGNIFVCVFRTSSEIFVFLQAVRVDNLLIKYNSSSKYWIEVTFLGSSVLNVEMVVLGESSQDGRIRGFHNHGDRFRPPTWLVGPLPNGRTFWLINGRPILTTCELGWSSKYYPQPKKYEVLLLS